MKILVAMMEGSDDEQCGSDGDDEDEADADAGAEVAGGVKVCCGERYLA